MLSLDKNILDKNSAAAKRMIEYGKQSVLYIVLPHDKTRSVKLSESVHVHATGGGKLWQVIRLTRYGSRIVRDHKNDILITTQDPFMTGLVGWRLKIRYHAPLEVQAHGDFYGSDYYKKSGLKHWLYYYLGKFVLRRADAVRVAGERIKQSLLPLGIPAEKIEVRPIKVDADAIADYQPKFNLHEKYPGYSKIFLCLGRLDPVKNIGWLIELFKEIPADRLLVIVGSGGERRKLAKLSAGLPNVQMEEWTDDPWSYIKTADAIVFPSLSEGYGLAPMEAAAAGMPVIMNDVGVAGFELKEGLGVRIISVSERQKWIEAILNQ